MSRLWHVGIDIGGTFTDVVAVEHATGAVNHLKVPSSRRDPAGAVLRGLRALTDEAGVEPDQMRLLLHGTTLATNAIIERRLARTALVTTEGFRDVLEIGRHWRLDLYDPFMARADPLVPRDLRFEVRERIDADGGVLQKLDHGSTREVVEQLRESGAEAVAVAFLHAYRNPDHEQEMAELLRQSNGYFVCASSELLRELKEYERTSTTVLNVALMPLIAEYVDRLERGLQEVGSTASLFIIQSNGGALTPSAARSRPASLALSGPVGGVVACVELGRAIGEPNLIGFDMGGTSSDVSIIDDYAPRYTTELVIGGLPVRLPSVQVHSIGAGGGSIASVDTGGALRVGPESAGSDPGPACYGAGGELPTVTDCQLILGRLTELMPLADRLTLSVKAARCAVESHVAAKLGIDIDAAAAGVIEVANAAMEGAVRVALRDRGDDPRDFALVAFGGAGPLHAVELARRLAISKVIVPLHPGTLSAAGFLAADVRLDFAVSEMYRSDAPRLSEAAARVFAELERQATGDVRADARLDLSRLEFERSCDLRYLGQAYEVNVPVPGEDLDDAILAATIASFHELHHRAYAYSSPDEPCEIVTFRVSARVRLDKPPAARLSARPAASPDPGSREVYVSGLGRRPTPTYDRGDLSIGSTFAGPAVVHQADATTFIPRATHARLDAHGNLVLTLGEVDS